VIPAAADKFDPNEKPWSYDPYNHRTLYAEDEPLNDTCPGQGVTCESIVDDAQINPGGDVDWYHFDVALAGTRVTVGTDYPTMGGSCDTYIELYDSCTGTRLAYDDDSGPGAYSLISNYVTTHSGTYMVKVRGYGSSTTGAYKLFILCTEPVPPPENDECDGALPIERCTTGTLDGDLTNANNNYDPGVGTPPASCTGYAAAGKDVTYLLALVAGDQVHLVYTGNAYDASCYIVTDCDNVNDSCVVGVDAGYNVETIDWTCPAGGTYFLILDAYGTNTGTTFSLAYEITCPVSHVCCLGEACYVVLEAECTTAGGEWHPEWNTCTPNPCALPHVCCVGETCTLVLEDACAELGGVFHPEWSTCAPNPCALPHACCVGETCSLVTEEECAALQGVFHPEWTTCTPNPCEAPHVCCVGEDCYVILADDCATMGGAFHPEWDSCGPPNPCQTTPAQPDTWGGVKSLYRH
jgi:hypothetical protein